MTKIKDIETRLETLAQAHRVLAARNESLIMCCRIMFPFIKIDAGLKQRLMTSAYDALTQHMEKANFDDEFQAIARAAIDEIFSTLKP